MSIDLKESEARREIQTADANCSSSERDYRRLKAKEIIGTTTSLQDERNRIASNMAKTIELYIKSLITQFFTIKLPNNPPDMRNALIAAGFSPTDLDLSPEEQQLLLTTKFRDIRSILNNGQNRTRYPRLTKLYESDSRRGSTTTYIKDITEGIKSITYLEIGHDLEKGLLVLSTMPTPTDPNYNSEFVVNNIAGRIPLLSIGQIMNKGSKIFIAKITVRDEADEKGSTEDDIKELSACLEEVLGTKKEAKDIFDGMIGSEVKPEKKSIEVEALKHLIENLMKFSEKKSYQVEALKPSWEETKVGNSEVKDAFIKGRYAMVSNSDGQYYIADIETLYQLMMAFNRNMGEIWKESVGIGLDSPGNLATVFHIWPDSESELTIRDVDGGPVRKLKCNSDGRLVPEDGTIDLDEIDCSVGKTIEYVDDGNPTYLGCFEYEVTPVQSLEDENTKMLLSRDKRRANLEKENEELKAKLKESETEKSKAQGMLAKAQEMLDKALGFIRSVKESKFGSFWFRKELKGLPDSNDGQDEPR